MKTAPLGATFTFKQNSSGKSSPVQSSRYLWIRCSSFISWTSSRLYFNGHQFNSDGNFCFCCPSGNFRAPCLMSSLFASTWHYFFLKHHHHLCANDCLVYLSWKYIVLFSLSLIVQHQGINGTKCHLLRWKERLQSYFLKGSLTSWKCFSMFWFYYWLKSCYLW